ncbi:MAG: hypothetical protein VX677_12560, partial [Candidatus Poribacteria bacterium]|nr:hypothetical protein [Candidatus Poribacteria bacterium]
RIKWYFSLTRPVSVRFRPVTHGTLKQKTPHFQLVSPIGQRHLHSLTNIDCDGRSQHPNYVLNTHLPKRLILSLSSNLTIETLFQEWEPQDY